MSGAAAFPARPVLGRLERGLARLGSTLSWLNLGVVLLMWIIVLLRYAANTGSIALQDTVVYAHATVFMLGAAYGLQREAHVRVDISHQRFSERGKALADLWGTLLFLLPFCVFLLVISYRYVAGSWAIWEGPKDAGGLPGVFLLKTLIPASALLLATQGLVNLVRLIDRLRTGRCAG